MPPARRRGRFVARRRPARRRNNPSRRKSRMARFSIPIAPLVGALPITMVTWNAARVNPVMAGGVFIKGMTGVDIQNRRFDFQALFGGLFPLVAGMMIHRMGNGLGFNRILSRSGLPIRL